MLRLRLIAVGLVAILAGAAGCSAGSGPSAADQTYLAQVHGAAADIGQYRSDAQLVRLGHAVCDDLAAGASYQEVADRLSIDAGADTLPSADLGAVITAAARTYCPRFAGEV